MADYGAIIVLGGDNEYDEATQMWRTSNSDRCGITNAYWRNVAGQILQCRNNCPIIVAGGETDAVGPEPKPTIAAVMKRELIELGVSANMIREENSSKNTYQQLVNCLAIVNAGDIFGPLAMVSNWWHLSRIEAMMYAPREHYSHLPSLTRAYGKGYLFGAEQIIQKFGSDTWRAEVVTNRLSKQDLAARIALEQKGVEDILSGKYRLG